MRLLCPLLFLKYLNITLPYCYKLKLFSPTSSSSLHLRVMLSHALHIIASECVFVSQWLVVVASLSCFVQLVALSYFRKQFLGRGSRPAQSQAYGQGRTVCSFSPRQPPWCETEGSNERPAKRVLYAWKRVCALVSPKDVLLLIQKPSIAPSPQWVSHLLPCTVVYFSSAKVCVLSSEI